MARKNSKRPLSPARRRSFQPRDLLLAGLGAVSLGKKEVQKLRLRAAAEAGPMRRKAVAIATQAKTQLIDAKSQIRARLQPALVALGVKPAASKRASRKPAVRRARRAA